METVVKPRTYFVVFTALLLLTALTVGLTFAKLGAWHSPVGLVIASVKVLLIVLFFMHALRSPKLIWIAALSGLFWLGILLTFTLTDYLTRSWPTY